jgi:2-polyprenyl-3-methyl-5-hydroxy-6-metoxy-1,4-benzoquinol methylase
MEPFGMALEAYFNGAPTAALIVRRDDGNEATLPMSLFFRDEEAFTELERMALARCDGRVLDIGTGAGSQCLALQRRGLHVAAIDISPKAVAIAQARGVADARCADVMRFDGGPFDTLLMLGHGIGMVETLDGLRAFLVRAGALLAPAGQLLLDSMDVGATTDPAHVAYHDANRTAGRYIGEIRMQFQFGSVAGPFCGWLQVDAGTLGDEAARLGWACEVIGRGAHGDYLAKLTRPQALAAR